MFSSIPRQLLILALGSLTISSLVSLRAQSQNHLFGGRKSKFPDRGAPLVTFRAPRTHIALITRGRKGSRLQLLPISHEAWTASRPAAAYVDTQARNHNV